MTNSIRSVLEELVDTRTPKGDEDLDKDVDSALQALSELVLAEKDKVKENHPSDSKNYSFNDGWLCGAEVALDHISNIILKG